KRKAILTGRVGTASRTIAAFLSHRGEPRQLSNTGRQFSGVMFVVGGITGSRTGAPRAHHGEPPNRRRKIQDAARDDARYKDPTQSTCQECGRQERTY